MQDAILGLGLKTIAQRCIRNKLSRGPDIISSPNSELPIIIEDAFRLLGLLRWSGLTALVHPTPESILSVISSSEVRTSVKPHDKFYGTQATFGIKMAGEYDRHFEEVRNQFLGTVWSRFAPALALTLNRMTALPGSNPTKLLPGSINVLSHSETSLDWFSWSSLQDGQLECCPTGFSAVRVDFTPDGFPIFTSRADESTEPGPFRLEVLKRSAHGRDEKIKAVVIYYGLPPIPVSFEGPELASFGPYQGSLDCHNVEVGWWVRTTRLLYVGSILNTMYSGLKHGVVHVYIEYFLEDVGKGHRVGTLVSEEKLMHYSVEGGLVLG
jgi:hypothetical protein